MVGWDHGLYTPFARPAEVSLACETSLVQGCNFWLLHLMVVGSAFHIMHTLMLHTNVPRPPRGGVWEGNIYLRASSQMFPCELGNSVICLILILSGSDVPVTCVTSHQNDVAIEVHSEKQSSLYDYIIMQLLCRISLITIFQPPLSTSFGKLVISDMKCVFPSPPHCAVAG